MIIKVAGIDPSLRACGLAKGTYDIDTDELDVTSLGLIETEKETGKQIRTNSDDLRRAGLLTIGIHDWIADCGVVFAEIPSGAQSASAAKALGMATAILGGIGLVGPFTGKLIQVMASESKKLATGSKNASKQEMIDFAVERWPNAGWLTRKLKGKIEPLAKNEHLADAAAAIYAGTKTDQFRSLIHMMRSLTLKHQ